MRVTNDGTNGGLPLGVSNATMLTLANAGGVWSNAASNTAGAWDFGDNTSLPRLLYNDYDGTGGVYGCSGMQTFVFTNCGSLIPGQ